METYTKPPLTFSKQLDLLAQRGLIISDRIKAEKFLSQVNYYRLSAYCLPFETKRHQFKVGTKFDQIQQLYEFDRRLRFLMDEALEVIEISVRTSIAYYLAHSHDPFAHENRAKFYKGFDHAEWINKVHEEAVRSKETFIEHYRNKYNGFPQLPIWMAVEIMSFGALSQLYHNLLRNDQIAIAKKIGFHHSVLISWLHTFTYIRNICAHHSRIWNRELSIALTVPKDDVWNKVNTKRIASVIFAINYFLSKLPLDAKVKSDWKTKMNLLLLNPVDMPNFYNVMGFPQKWENDPLWM